MLNPQLRIALSILTTFALIACSNDKGGGQSVPTYDTAYLHGTSKQKIGMKSDKPKTNSYVGFNEVASEKNKKFKSQLLDLSQYKQLTPEEYKPRLAKLFSDAWPDDMVKLGYRYLLRSTDTGYATNEDGSTNENVVTCLALQESEVIVLRNKSKDVVELSTTQSDIIPVPNQDCSSLDFDAKKITNRKTTPFSKENVEKMLGQLASMVVYEVDANLSKQGGQNTSLATFIVVNGLDYYVLAFNSDSTVHLDGVVKLANGQFDVVSMIPVDKISAQDVAKLHHGKEFFKWDEQPCPDSTNDFCAMTVGEKVTFDINQYTETKIAIPAK